MRTIIVCVKNQMKTAPAKPSSELAQQTPLRVSSEALLGPRRELVILHNAREYRLRLTQNGKLILTA
ncbi:MAG TPA: hemin uptake protein HemP [Burkholderiales bacterium]|jgi:hemin uptake protein HemP|nr:hemin uptake protein HemP [Burkholderiales bacterium]HXJ09899.1 hemin uptake protein HemP [Burkholderiales bacterium]